MTDEQPDYTAMTGAQFQRECGVDPAKWAAALLQNTRYRSPGNHAAEVEYIANWFRDAMDAAVKHARPVDLVL